MRCTRVHMKWHHLLCLCMKWKVLWHKESVISHCARVCMHKVKCVCSWNNVFVDCLVGRCSDQAGWEHCTGGLSLRRTKECKNRERYCCWLMNGILSFTVVRWILGNLPSETLLEKASSEHTQFEHSNQVVIETLQQERDNLQSQLQQHIQDNAQLTQWVFVILAHSDNLPSVLVPVPVPNM